MIATACVLLVASIPVVAVGIAWWTYTGLHRVDVSSALSVHGARHGSNILIVGTDSRERISASDANASAFLGEEVSGARTDTIMVLHIEGSVASLISIPRDLWVTDPATQHKGRINATYGEGASNLVRAVTSLGIPVDEYMEIDFLGFGAIVDAIGGVTIDVPAPARDAHSGLSIPKAGRHHFGGTTALAYVRSRYYEQQIGGIWKADGTADLGRTERQRAFLTALLHALMSTRSPTSLVRLPGAVRDGLRVSRSMGISDFVQIARSVNGAKLSTDVLPVTPRVTSGGADVLELQNSSETVIDQLAR
jgi:LCP family protein required for cell wall assembly